MDIIQSFNDRNMGRYTLDNKYTRHLQDVSPIPIDGGYIVRNNIKDVPKTEELTEAELINMDTDRGKLWAAASKVVYDSMYDGVNALTISKPENDQDFGRFGVEFMGQFDHNLSMMGYNVAKLQGVDERTKLALHHMMTDFGQLPMFSWNGAYRATKGIFTDPTTYASLGTLGLGFLGRAGVKQTTKQGFKELLRQGITSPYAIAALEGGAYTGMYDYLTQEVNIEAGVQDDVNLGQLARATGTGVVAGPAIVGAGELAVKGAQKAAPVMRDLFDDAGQAADQRIAERAQDKSTTLTSGVDPMPAVDAALSAAGRAVRPAKSVDEARAAFEASPNDPALKKQYLDLRRARDAELSQMPASEQLELDTSYRMQHQPRGPQDGGGRLDDITAGGFPEDVYSADGLRFYGNPRNLFDRQSHAAILAARGNPEAEITIYRGVPKDVDQINAGDWVTLSPDYAAMHAADGYGPNGDEAGKVISMKVKVKDVFSDGNDLNEFGYFPEDLAEIGVKKIVPPKPDEPGIVAFHGSGADFDEFRLEMIGTGEGAQAYGYGLYFTDSEDIAKFYKDTVSTGAAKIPYGSAEDAAQAIPESLLYSDIDGYRSYLMGDAEEMISSVLTKQYFNVEPEQRIIDANLDVFKRDGVLDIKMRDGSRVTLLRDQNGDQFTATPIKEKTGKTYKVGLAPKPDELLDYDTPLNQQPRVVQKQIENLVGDLLAGEPEAYDRFDFKALAAIRGESPTEGYSPTGDDILTDLQNF